MEEAKSKRFDILDMQVSASGKYAAVTRIEEKAPGENAFVLDVYNLETRKCIWNRHEFSITYFGWHPKTDKLLFVSVMEGLNFIDFEKDPKGVLSEGVVRHEEIFLEMFKFSPEGHSAGYFLHDVSAKQVMSDKQGASIREMLFREEKSQLLFYEKSGSANGKIVGLGRAWSWIDENRILFSRKTDLLVKNILTDKEEKIYTHSRFIFDLIPVEGGALIMSIAFEEVDSPEGEIGLYYLDLEWKNITPVNLDKDFSPRIVRSRRKGDRGVIVQLITDGSYWVAHMDVPSAKLTPLSPAEGMFLFPCSSTGYVYFIAGTPEAPMIARRAITGGEIEPVMVLC